MGRYRVMLNGKNFWMKVDDEPQRLGFYTTRFVEAPNSDQARQHALRLVREDPKLAGMVLNESSDPPMLSVGEIEEVESFEEFESVPPGFTFYPDESEV